MLVKLSNSDNVATIDINRDDGVPSQEGQDLTVLGFGNTDTDQSDLVPSDVLQKIVTGYVTFETCSVAQDPEMGGAYGDPITGATAVTGDWLCTLRNDPRVGNCVGDSGGPVILEGSNPPGDDLLVGVVSG